MNTLSDGQVTLWIFAVLLMLSMAFTTGVCIGMSHVKK